VPDPSQQRVEQLRRFILETTALRRPAHVPEVRLHLADDLTALWIRAEAELGRALEPPFWASAWAGGLAVARLLLDEPQRVAGRSVLDLGSGSGLCAIAAALAGATVTAADVDELSLVAVELNAAANGVPVRALQRDLLAEEPPPFDVVLAGDVCYERTMSERAVGWLRRAHRGGAEVLLGDPGRAYLPEAGLTLLARYAIAPDTDLESPNTRATSVYGLSDPPTPEPSGTPPSAPALGRSASIATSSSGGSSSAAPSNRSQTSSGAADPTAASAAASRAQPSSRLSPRRATSPSV
jgi:predicted nicotinamide N-methyase